MRRPAYYGRPGRCCALAAVAVSLLVRSVSAFVTAEGRVPREVTPEFLLSEYLRLYRIAAPGRAPDRTPLRVLFYAGRDRLAPAGALPEWGAGGAVGPDTVIIPVDRPFVLDRNMAQISVHELAHCVLSRGYPRVTIPRWFHEGCAMLLSGEVSFDEQAALAQALLAGRVLRLESIDSVNTRSLAHARLAYSTSHAVLLFMTGAWGIEVIPAILEAAQRRHDFWLGVEAIVGLSRTEFEQQAAGYIRTNYGPLAILMDFYYVWLLILLLAIAGFFATRARSRRKALQMAREEREAEETAVRQAAPSDQPSGGGPDA